MCPAADCSEIPAAGVTVGGSAKARTFTGTVFALDRCFMDERARVTYRAARAGDAAATLTGLAKMAKAGAARNR